MNIRTALKPTQKDLDQWHQSCLIEGVTPPPDALVLEGRLVRGEISQDDFNAAMIGAYVPYLANDTAKKIDEEVALEVNYLPGM